MARLAAAVAFTLAVLAVGAPCFGKLDGDTIFETPCTSILADDGRGMQVREFSGDATLVTYAAPPSYSYDEGLQDTADLIICYFTGECNENATNLLDARTVPLTLRPSTKSFNFYEGGMAIAPSKWPRNASFPVATYGDMLGNLNGTIGVLVGHFPQVPTEANFDSLCSELAKGLPALGFRVLPHSHFSPTHARYYSQNKANDLPWDAECWLGVAHAGKEEVM
jgi:hypothetical protein